MRRSSKYDALSPTPAILTQLALYITATAATGIPLLLVASILIGGIAALEARRADSLFPATTLHLVWSIGMASMLPVAIRQWATARRLVLNGAS